jgi:group I intron endonuclease
MENSCTTLCQNETITEPLKTLEKKTEGVNEFFTINTSNPNEKEKGKPIILKIGRVYIITNLINNKKYVGITTRTIKRRFNQHIWESKGRCLWAINKAIRKYGEENFTIDLVEELYNITEKELFLKESFYIDKYNTLVDNKCGYNLVKCDNNKLIVSEATRRKMSELKKGEHHPLYGKHHPNEVKKKISLSLKGMAKGDKNYFYGKRFCGKRNSFYGKTHTDKTKRLLSIIHKGKCLDEETKRKMSLAHIGKSVREKSWNFDNIIRKFKNIYTNEEFLGTQYDFRKQHNLNKVSVCVLIKGRLKTLKGWILVRA